MYHKVLVKIEFGGQLYDGFAFDAGVTPNLQDGGFYTFDGFPDLLVAKSACKSLSFGPEVPAGFLLMLTA